MQVTLLPGNFIYTRRELMMVAGYRTPLFINRTQDAERGTISATTEFMKAH